MKKKTKLSLWFSFSSNSLICLNNESVNIWSHLIGAFIFIYFFLRDIYHGKALPFLTSKSDYYFVLFYTFSVIVRIKYIQLNFDRYRCRLILKFRHVWYVQLSFICLIVSHHEHLLTFSNLICVASVSVFSVVIYAAFIYRLNVIVHGAYVMKQLLSVSCFSLLFIMYKVLNDI